MSKYVKELMMDQLRSDLDGEPVGPDPRPEGAGRDRRAPAPPRPAEEVDPDAGAEEHAGPPGLHRDGDGRACRQYLEGPRWPSGAATASPSWPRRSPTQVKTLKKPEIKGGAVDGVVDRPRAGRGHHQAAQPRGPDRPGGRAWPWPRRSGSSPWPTPRRPACMGQLKTLSEGAGGDGRGAGAGDADGRRRRPTSEPERRASRNDDALHRPAGSSDTRSGRHPDSA